MLVCAAMLALVIDVSRSIDADEYQLQMQGTARVFASERVTSSLNPANPLAVSVVIFSDYAIVSVPWMLLRTPQDSLRLSARISAIENPNLIYTNALDGLNTALNLYEDSPCESDNKVVDISADGTQNAASNEVVTEDYIVNRALSMNVRINALPITTNNVGGVDSPESLYEYYNNSFVSPTGGFIVRAEGFDDFSRAIYHKISTEIASR